MKEQKEYDVIVAGGGIAGISAALAASRQGKKTLLIERECELGGLATLGLVTIFLPLCDGNGTQVVGGIGEELIRLSVKYGWEAENPAPWLENGSLEERTRYRYMAQYNPHLFALETERLLLQTGVEILYDTCIIGAEISENSGRRIIQALRLFNRSGEERIFGHQFIDCTGDAMLAAQTGAPVEKNETGNLPAAWYYSMGEGKLRLNTIGACDSVAEQEGAVPIGNRFDGLDAWENSRVIQLGHATVLRDVSCRREQISDYVPITMPGILQVRMTRMLKGAYALKAEDVNRKLEDTVGMIGDWKTPGKVYRIPYGCLYSEEVENLLVAGRCISVADEEAWDVTRVIPCCCVTGEAAGIAAALADESKTPVAEVEISSLREKLREAGAILDEIK